MRKSFIALAACALALGGGLQAIGQTQSSRDVDPENVLVIDTNKGRIIAELVPAVAPKTVERIKTLTRQGLYDNRTFFRVIDGFMAQTGDPEDTGRGASALPDLEAEFVFRRGSDAGFVAMPNGGGKIGFVGLLPVRTEPDAQMAVTADGKVRANVLFCPGVLGLARSNDPNSGNSQFFLMRGKSDQLNGRYTAFGRVLQGLDVVRAIKTGEPVDPPQDRMTKVRLLADLPAAERPKIRVPLTTGPDFAARLAAKDAPSDICDLDIQATVQ